MKTPFASLRVQASAVALAVLAFGSAQAADVKLSLSGDQETPAVTTSASGSGVISVGDDKSVKGSVKTSGLSGVIAAGWSTGRTVRTTRAEPSSC